MRKIITFILIPLILSIGIFPSLQNSDIFIKVEALKSKGNHLTEIGSKKVCGDKLCFEKQQSTAQLSDQSDAVGLFSSVLKYTETPLEIDPEKGYAVTEIGDGLYWLIDHSYQTMFLTTGEGVIIVDAPRQMGEKIIQAISEVTNEPITHVIYSHIHKDHIGSAHLYPDEA